MTKIENVIQQVEHARDYHRSIGNSITADIMDDALKLLEKQKQIKSPNEFKSLLLGMFDSIWDVEIDHPVFQDTVGELMEGVLQAYSEAVKWDDE